MLTISQLYLYPIKSLAGIAVQTAEVTDRGFANDRRYLLVTPDNVFITQRTYPKMALLYPEITDHGLAVINSSTDGRAILITRPEESALADQQVTIWSQVVKAQHVSRIADSWFSNALGIKCKLVYMPDRSLRPVAPSSGLRPAGKITSFADAYPFLLIGEESLADLNDRYQGSDPIGMNRFRPNIVFSGGQPYAEDQIGQFTINDISFTGLEKCARCGVPNVNPKTGKESINGEPLRTLMKYRTENRKVYFGMNLVHAGTGIISVGDELQLAN